MSTRQRRVLCNDQVYDDEYNYLFNRVVYEEEGCYYLYDIKNQGFSSVNPNVVKGEMIPKDALYPKVSELSNVRICGSEKTTDPDIFIKTSNPVYYDRERGYEMAKHMVKEIQMFELLLSYPHPNIAKYYGCVVQGERIIGLCIKKYVKTLKESIRQGDSINKDKILNDLEASIAHLHSLGYIHDDINPNNLMLDQFGNLILIDFDSAKKIGTKRDGKCGTDGWCLENDIAEKKNDLYSISKIINYLNNKNTN